MSSSLIDFNRFRGILRGITVTLWYNLSYEVLARATEKFPS